jgi:hypothetical protein
MIQTTKIWHEAKLGRLLTAGLAAQQLERGHSVMLFEETTPVGTDTTFHLPATATRSATC